MKGGVLRLLGDPAAVEAELVRRGWIGALVPPAASDEALWDGLSATLGLPGYFGRNLDALDECLADLDGPTALVLTAWTTYACARPERWRRLLAVLDERSRRDEPPFLVVLADAPGLRSGSRAEDGDQPLETR